MKKLMRLLVLGLAAASLGGCEFIGMLARESTLSLTERRGLQSFTLIGDLPADFGLRVTAQYYPVDENGLNCQKSIIYSDRSLTRERTRLYDMPIDAAAQLSKRKIPLKHYIGMCEMKLVKIDITIDERHGQHSWQNSSVHWASVFYVYDSSERVTGTDNFDEKGHLQVDARCAWSFQISNWNDELTKSLTCHNVRADLKLDQLAGKSVTLAVTVAPEKSPYYGSTWIKFPTDWNSCLLKERGLQRCQTPPEIQNEGADLLGLSRLLGAVIK